MAVTEMIRIPRLANTLHRTGFTADDQVITGKIPAPQGKRHQAEILLAASARKRQSADHAFRNPVLSENRTHIFRTAGMGEDIRIGIHFRKLGKEIFPSPHVDHPVVQQCSFHGKTRYGSRIASSRDLISG